MNHQAGFSFDRMNVGAGQSTCVVVGYRLCGYPINWLHGAWMRMTQRLLPVRYDGSSTNLEILCEWQLHQTVHQYRIELCFQLTPPKLW